MWSHVRLNCMLVNSVLTTLCEVGYSPPYRETARAWAGCIIQGHGTDTGRAGGKSDPVSYCFKENH